MIQSPDNLIWLDLEMTGLDTDNDYIIEIATIITDNQLNILEEGPVIAIHQDDAILQAMDEWNTKQHAKSGLIDRVRNSRYTTADAERMTLTFVEKFVPAKTSPMCGNSICQDRRFLHRLMPQLEQYFHYRNLDVSTVKELVKRWYPEKEQYEKESTHIALEDVRNSINELRFYQEKYI
ncbi:MAG: oligoribonuclease [Gammaproteobacteria bacterium]|nr:oligoribonuclease [Gammaproteobacteria bacterium]